MKKETKIDEKLSNEGAGLFLDSSDLQGKSEGLGELIPANAESKFFDKKEKLWIKWKACFDLAQDKYNLYRDALQDKQAQSLPLRFPVLFGFWSPNTSWRERNSHFEFRKPPIHANSQNCQDSEGKYRALYLLLEGDLRALQEILQELVRLERAESLRREESGSNKVQGPRLHLYASFAPQTNLEEPDLPTLEGFQLGMESTMFRILGGGCPAVEENPSNLLSK